jgi:hypothetical protein
MASETKDAVQPLLDILKQIKESGYTNPVSAARAVAKVARFAGVYPVPHLAVSICENLYVERSNEVLEEGKSDDLVRLAGKLAYCTAMPKLSGAANIRDFIACVTYGMLIDVIPGSEGTRLLYCAQVAHTALTKRPQKRGKSSHVSTAKPTVNDTNETT